MKTLIAYYSFTGNNRLLAQDLASRLNADSVEIAELRRRPRTMGTIFLDMLLNRRPRIQQPVIAWDRYDRVILIAPVWNAQLANPMCTFIRSEKDHLNNYSVVTVCGGRNGQEERIRKQLTKLAGKPPLSITQLSITDHLPEARKKAEGSSGIIRIKSLDLEYFRADIEKLLSKSL